jgi:alkyl hydroperoxide reductase subunit D
MSAALEVLRDAIPEPARDLRLNLQSVLAESSLSTEQRWGVAVACAIASRNARLREAVLADAREAVSAAVIMGMNNVLYRFRHLVEKETYGQRPARLRMNRLVKPAGSKVDFELFSLAVSAINGCGTCMQAHEKVVVDGGLTEEQVFDAVRIASAIHGAAVALDVAA